ncbi:MAG: hypothetical protein ACRES2_00630 [Steroidobacteraceae bacterium]
MRSKCLVAPLVLIAGLNAATMFAASAAAPAVTTAVAIAPVKISASFQKALHDQYGAAEGGVLQEAVAERLQRGFKSAGAAISDSAPLRIDVSIERAVPSHPTRYQIQLNPSLDAVRSVSLGGAHLHAVLREADGKLIDEVDYDRFATSFEDASPSSDAWGDARVSIERFSDLVVKSWRQH